MTRIPMNGPNPTTYGTLNTQARQLRNADPNTPNLRIRGHAATNEIELKGKKASFFFTSAKRTAADTQGKKCLAECQKNHSGTELTEIRIKHEA